IPTKDSIYLTSNRDEKVWRKPALPPRLYQKHSCEMLYPKDGDAQGSWISLCSNGNAGVLLNGAFEKHAPKEVYAESRGLVLLEIMDNAYPLRHFFKYPLQGVEPFTLVIWENGNLYECRWDEKERHCQPLKAYRPYIWSSATLYDAEIRKRREYWFANFLNRNPQPKQEDILHFHQSAGEGDEQNDLQMNRQGKVFTVSITSLTFTNTGYDMRYIDLNKKAALPFATSLQQKRA
ncbi:MAG: NRDE family protein, partial [Bacteroidota bacterium]|nr:NRDE family protein [Bacteroidota bacterium]